MLKIVEYIKKHGLEKTAEDLSLSINDAGHKVLLKYSQIDTPFEYEEARECRGLILNKNDWTPMSYPFKKFFNHGEEYADKIDWDNARVLEKVDGSLMVLYFDPIKNEWCVQTSGSPEASGNVHNDMEMTFHELFWWVFEQKGLKTDSFNKDWVYCFELTSPYNIIVKPHGYSDLTLLMVRDMNTLKEFPYEDVVEIGKEVGVEAVGKYELGNVKDIGRLLREVEKWDWEHEGFVVVDEHFKRVKVKNPDYVVVHHLKSRTSEHNIMEIIKKNELEEFLATFPEREEEIKQLHTDYMKLIDRLNDLYDKVYKPKNISGQERKKFALSAKEKAKEYGLGPYVSALFMLQDGKISSFREFLENMDNRKLYKALKK